MAGVNAVLRAWHVMLGRDMHIPWPPGSPAPAPAPVPYVTTAPMMGILPMVTSKMTATAFADSMAPIMVRGTDIGPMIPHSGPPSTTLPIEMVTSGSKSHFGVTKWKVKDQTGAPGCVAVGLLGMTNLNLNCGTPAPTPFGLVIAPTTHLAAMTLGDLVSGLYMMAWDYMAQRIMYMAGNMLGEAVSSMVGKVAARLGLGALSRTAARQMARALGVRANIGPVARQLRADRIAALTKVAERTTIALGLAAGSPLGISTSTLGNDHAKSAYDRVADAVDPQGNGDALGQAVDDYFNSPAVTDVPSVPEPSAPDAGVPDASTGDAGAPSVDSGAGDAGQSGSPGVSSTDPGDGANMSSVDQAPTSGTSTPEPSSSTSTDPSPATSSDGEPNACTPETGSDDVDGNSSR